MTNRALFNLARLTPLLFLIVGLTGCEATIDFYDDYGDEIWFRIILFILLLLLLIAIVAAASGEAAAALIAMIIAFIKWLIVDVLIGVVLRKLLWPFIMWIYRRLLLRFWTWVGTTALGAVIQEKIKEIIGGTVVAGVIWFWEKIKDGVGSLLPEAKEQIPCGSSKQIDSGNIEYTEWEFDGPGGDDAAAVIAAGRAECMRIATRRATRELQRRADDIICEDGCVPVLSANPVVVVTPIVQRKRGMGLVDHYSFTVVVKASGTVRCVPDPNGDH